MVRRRKHRLGTDEAIHDTNTTPHHQPSTSDGESEGSDGDSAAGTDVIAAADLQQAVSAAIAQALPPPPHSYSAEVLEEMIVGEVGTALRRWQQRRGNEEEATSSSNAPWASADTARAAFTDAVTDLYPTADDDYLSLFFEALSRRLRVLVEASEAAARAAEEAEMEGQCALCEREMKLTFHHLIPREVHGRYKASGKRRGGLSSEQLSAGIWICRPCHSAIHRTEDNATLAERYNTLEALQQHPEIAKFAAWAARQQVRSGPRHHR